MGADNAKRRKPAATADRLDALDGLRAVAVAGVLAYHAGVQGVSGGMFGVDVFFVLSGFLITRLLLAEYLGSGRIRLARFWGRRARRLLPPLLLTVAGAMAYVRWGNSGTSLTQVRGDALATVGYVANWRFVFSGQGYFVRYGPPSPLLHTWSLGVEEQFYLLWPLALLVVARRGGAVAVAKWAAGGALISAGLMALLHNLGVSDSRLYYGTDTRAQALLVGAALAAVLAVRTAPVGGTARGATIAPGEGIGSGAAIAPGGGTGSGAAIVRSKAAALAGRLFRRAAQRRSPLWVLGWVSALGLLWMLHAVGGATGWLYDGGFLAVALASVCVLATVVISPRGALARGLAWRPLVALGRISYGVYLYHWPLFAWLDGARTGLRGWPLVGVRVGATLAVATVSYFAVERPIREIGRRPAVARRRVRRPWIAALGTVGVSLGVVAATLPGVAAAGQETLSAQSPPAKPGVPTRTLIVGDSMGLTLGIGLSYQSAEWGVTVIPGAWLGCDLDPQSTVEVMGTVSQATQGCPQWRTSWRSLVAKDDPDVVMLTMGRWEVLNRIYDGRWTHIGEPAWDAHLTAELDQAIDALSSRGATVVLTTLPYIQGTTEQPDGAPWDMNQPARTDAYNAVVRAAAAARPKTSTVIDLNALIDPDGHYVSSIDGIRVRNSDDEHFSPQGGEYLRPFILPELETLGTAHALARGAATSR